jgi:transposase
MRVPLINAAEWKLIEPLLPPTGGPGKPRSDDRLMLSGLFYSAATKCSLESLPVAYGNPRSLRTRKQRWERDGTLAKLMEAGEPAIARMHRNFWGYIRQHTIAASADGYRNSREFWGRGVMPKQPHLQPKGRYAGR